ncbi:MAG: ribonuclease H-like domain-containing protein [Bacteroidota bacterium]
MGYPKTDLRRVLFLDIETAALQPSYTDLPEDLKEHWKHKSRRHIHPEDYPYFDEDFDHLYQDKAAIYAEFGRVVCISVGILANRAGDEAPSLHIKSFAHPEEYEILLALADLLNEFYYDRHNQFICGHNIKEFDIPFICRRMMIHRIPLPNLLDIAGYKPWQTHHLLDTMDMWKYGDYKHYTSLDLLCSVLDVPSSKSEMTGADVSTAYWDGRIADIVRYCEQDVVATVRVYQRCVGAEMVRSESIKHVHHQGEEE